MFDKLRELFARKKPEPEKPVQSEAEVKPEPPKEPELSAKELATKNNEPYVAIIDMKIDPENVNNGFFELDFNDKFVLNLMRAGYKIKDSDTDQDIVDRWFTDVCRNVALEMFEQQQADPKKRILDYPEPRAASSKNIGGGRREIS